MKKNLRYLFGSALLFVGVSAFAQTYQPLAVTGFNQDVIANGIGAASTSTTTSVDAQNVNANFAYLALDFQLDATSALPTVGLPLNGQLTSPNIPGLTFSLMPYSGNNSLKLPNQNDSGTLTLTTPVAVSALYLATTSGDGGSTISVQVNFTDGTSQTVSGLPVTNWDSTPPAATPTIIGNIGRVKRTTGVVSTGNFQLFQITVPIEIGNQSKLVNSLTVTKTATGNDSQIPHVFAVSAQIPGSCPVIASSTGASASMTSGAVNYTLGSYGTGGTNITYTVEVYTDAAFTTAIAGSPFTGLTASSYTVPGLTFGTTYYYRVKANNGSCDSAYSTGSFTIAYCTPTTTNTTSTLYSITQFSTTLGYMNINQSTGFGAYNNYSTTQMVGISAGNTFNYSGTKYGGSTTVDIWVDWNQDLAFSDAEKVVDGGTVTTTTGTSFSGSITVPAGTANGNYRMRVRSRYFNYASSPCANILYGDAEDYTIAVSEQPADCPAPAAPVFTLGTITASSMTPVVTIPTDVPTGYVLVRSTSATLSATPVNGTWYTVGADFGGGKVAAVGSVAAFTDFLAANTRYYYFLFAYNNGGATCYGPIYSPVTSADASTCAVATAVSGASNIGNYSANLNATNIVGTGGSAATYTFEVYTDAEMANLFGSFTSATNSYALTGLDIATTYYFRAKAVTTGCFNDAWTTLASFTTQSLYTPLDVTGYSDDVIANGTGIANLSTTNAVDGASNAYIALNYQNAATSAVTSVGLPVNRILNNSGITGLGFIMPDYTGNNALRLPAQNQPATLTLTQPRKLSNLYLALTSGSGASTISTVINFTDGTSQASSSFDLIDWYNPGTGAQPALISNLGRANRQNATGAIETGNSKVFYVTLPVTEENQAKMVASVTITKTSPGATEPVPNIFAVSGKVIDDCPVLNTAFSMPTAGGANVTFGLLAGSSAADSYNYAVYTDEAMTTPVAGSPFTTTTTSLTVTGLMGNTTYYYSATAINTSCTSAPVTGSFTTTCVAPAAPAATAQTLCAGATVAELEATAAEGATVNWYATATATTPLTATTALTGTTYYVSQTVAGCESTRVAVVVTINALPEAPAVADQDFCGSATIADLEVTGADGAVFTWFAVDGEPLEATAPLESGVYFVSQTVGECTSPAAEFDVTVNPTPEAPIAVEDVAFCGSATVADLTAEGEEGATFTWYATEGGEALEATTALETGTYWVTQTVGTCKSTATEVAVAINSIPDAPATEPQTFCEGATAAELTATAAEGATLTWFEADGSTVLEAGAVLETGSYWVSQSLGECTSDVAQVAVTVNETPEDPEAEEEQTFTAGETLADLDVTFEEGTTVTWYIFDEDVFVAIPATTALEDGVTYYVSQSNGTCESELTPVTANAAAGIEGFNAKSLTVYPNPSNGVITVAANTNLTRLVLNNLLGQKVMEQNTNAIETQLNISALAAGTYILQVTSGNSTATVKVIKQ
ncbi:GEVED domain-containing protein [Flavobacterium sp. RHBU_24]|uniref:Ig-like domain-containing protein n=1 Tax=Flavobacterium sp. RHBU_24 TaxID=3391185 RepID=UPI003984D7E3